MDQRIVALYDEYTHTPLPRRIFLERLTLLTGSAAAIPAILAQIEPNYALAAQVTDNDPRISTERIRYPGATGEVSGYLVRPKAPARVPAVIVIHENRGLTPYIEDVARRLAVAGFAGLAPDLLSPLGGTPADADQAREMIGKLEESQTLANLARAVDYLAAAPFGTGKVGSLGFCWGGGLSARLPLAAPGIAAAVVFYGMPPDPASIAASSYKTPLLLHYAGLDDRINAFVPAFETALRRAGTPYTLNRYEGVNHAFHNDTSAERYNEAAAKLAWDRTIEFLTKQLG